MEDIERLREIATACADKNTCCHHSNFTVGAALLCTNGHIYSGCNIENDGIQSICAERTAFVKALSEGEKDFKAILIVGKEKQTDYYKKIVPCGYCRQFISEYTNDEFIIYTYDQEENKYIKYTKEELLPNDFRLGDYND